MTKIEKLARHLLRKVKPAHQPQIFGLPSLHKELKEKRHPGGGSYIDNYVGSLRRRGVIQQVGSIGSGHYYVFAEAVRNGLTLDLLKFWMRK